MDHHTHTYHASHDMKSMVAMMEKDIRDKFWLAFIVTLVIIAYPPMGEMIFGLHLPSPIPIPWLLFIWLRRYSSIVAGYFSIPELQKY